MLKTTHTCAVLCIVIYSCQFCAVSESTIAYRSDTIRDSNLCQFVAVSESTIAYRSDTIRDSNLCQAGAISESTSTYRSNTIGDGNLCQAGATVESPSTYRSNTIRNSFICNTFRDYNRACIFILIRYVPGILSIVCYSYFIIGCNVVTNSIYREVVGIACNTAQ